MNCDESLFAKDAKFVVEDQSDSSVIYLNIPIKFAEYIEAELTAEELDLVSGGASGDTSCNGWNPIKWYGTYLHWQFDNLAGAINYINNL